MKASRRDWSLSRKFAMVPLVAGLLDGGIFSEAVHARAAQRADRDANASLVGEYDIGTGAVSVALEASGALTLRVPGQPVYHLQSAGGLRFTLNELPGFAAQFHRDATGTVTHLTMYQPLPQGNFLAVRRSAGEPAPGLMASLDGDFAIGNAHVAVRVGPGNRALFTVAGQPGVEMQFAQGLRFTLKGIGGLWIEFVRDPGGAVNSFVIHEFKGDTTAVRVRGASQQPQIAAARPAPPILPVEPAQRPAPPMIAPPAASPPQRPASAPPARSPSQPTTPASSDAGPTSSATSDAEQFRLISRRAESGDVSAMTSYGLMYLQGRGTQVNENQALGWFRRAAAAGDGTAMSNIGILYLKGKGVATNDNEAIRWFRSGAEKGSPFAMYNLGMMLAAGKGTLKNDTEAARWYRQAAEHGHAAGMYQLGLAFLHGRGVNASDNEALAWLRRGAEAGSSEAMAGVRSMVHDGRGGMGTDEAVQFFQRLANGGNADAQFNLGMIYLDNRSASDDVQAMRALQKGADARHVDSMVALAVMYAEGRGTATNAPQAARWYRQAAEAGNTAAMTSLGMMLLEGQGIPKEEGEGERWLEKASIAGNNRAGLILAMYWERGRFAERFDRRPGEGARIAYEAAHDAYKQAAADPDPQVAKLGREGAQRIERRNAAAADLRLAAMTLLGVAMLGVVLSDGNIFAPEECDNFGCRRVR
jgi:TPR repeat protein